MTPPSPKPLTPAETLCAILVVWVGLLVAGLTMMSSP